MKEFPQIFAFYSFKGGVGRSMAVLNLAYALAAKGRNVLILDMNLEAPGLSGFLHREKEIDGFARSDMVDLVRWASLSRLPLDPLAFPLMSDYVVSIPPEKLAPIPRLFSELGRVDIIPAAEERDYYNRLASLAMGNLDQGALVKIGSVLRAWIKSLRFPIEVPDYYGPDCERTSSYDYVLVDSRTGITETGGLCIGPLSDQLVVLTALNNQNVEGTRKFLKEVGILKNINSPEDETERKPCLIVASLVPAGEIETKRHRWVELEKALGKVRLGLSYHPQLALKETIFTRDYRDEYLAIEYDRLMQELLGMADDGNDPNLLETICWLQRPSPEFLDALRRLLRLGATRSVTPLLGQLLSTETFAENVTDADFILWDRVCRVLSSEGSTARLEVLEKWIILLSNWSQRSTNLEITSLRLETARILRQQILQSKDASTVQVANALLDRGLTYSLGGNLQSAINDYTAVINLPDTPVEQKAIALYNRGVAHGQRGELDEAIANYTAVIQMADNEAKPMVQATTQNTLTASSHRNVIHRQLFDSINMFTNFIESFHRPNLLTNAKAQSLVNRGVTYLEKGVLEKAIADYTAVIQMPDAPADKKSQALFNRGVANSGQDELEKVIADYTAVIQMPGTPADRKAKALVNRSLAFARQEDPEKAIADYTAVIQMPDAPAEFKARALVNRGKSYAKRNEPENVIADYTAVIRMIGAPAEEKADALLHRGIWYDQLGEIEKAISDYTAIIQMSDAPARQKAKARINRSVKYAERDELEMSIGDSTAVIQMLDAPADQIAKALWIRGSVRVKQGELEKAIADYTAVIQMPDAPADSKAHALSDRGFLHFLAERYGDSVADQRQAISLAPDDSKAYGNLAIALLVQDQIGEALGAYDAALVFTDIGNLDDMMTDLRAAIDKHGQLRGAEEAMARLEARRKVLSQGTSANISGSTHQESVGGK